MFIQRITLLLNLSDALAQKRLEPLSVGNYRAIGNPEQDQLTCQLRFQQIN